MKLYLKRKNGTVDAAGEYDPETKRMTVLAGSKVSETIAYSDKFRGAKTIEKYRKEYTENRIVKNNVEFNSSSTAANFVTGSSTNGLTAWKNEDGVSLKQLLSD